MAQCAKRRKNTQVNMSDQASLTWKSRKDVHELSIWVTPFVALMWQKLERTGIPEDRKTGNFNSKNYCGFTGEPPAENESSKFTHHLQREALRT